MSAKDLFDSVCEMTIMTTRRLPDRRVLPVLALGSLVAVGGGLGIDRGLGIDAPSASARTVDAQQAVSGNWSGYIAQSSNGQNFSRVSGSWTQPSVSSSTDGYSAFWVGLGGASQQSESLEQVGTSADTSGGQSTYYAWYELVPAGEVKLNLAIHPGDHMTGSVTVNGSNVTISLADETTGQSLTKTLTMSNPDTSSAEWIAEAPSAQSPDGSLQTLPLANFGNVTFTNTSATAGGHTGPISDPDWTAQQVDLQPSGAGETLGGGQFSPAGLQTISQSSSAGASASSVSGNGSSFTVTYSTSGQSGAGGAGAGGYPSPADPGGYPGSADPGGYGGYPGYGYGSPGSTDPGGYGGYPGYGYGYPGGYIYGY